MDRPGRRLEDEPCGTVLLEIVEVKLPVPEAPDVPHLKGRRAIGQTLFGISEMDAGEMRRWR
jgi:hypothetical protein